MFCRSSGYFTQSVLRLGGGEIKRLQYSSVELTNYLGSQANQIRISCLQRLTSTTQDQLTRIGLYDLLSEAVLNSVNIEAVNYRLIPTGILSLLLNINVNNNINTSDIKLNCLTTSSKETTETDCLDCTLDTLKELQVWMVIDAE
ncbi:unnamed protein product [Trichobilharzia regenti]|nr:unnamed protein product [Trichobilharzia regenti]